MAARCHIYAASAHMEMTEQHTWSSHLLLFSPAPGGVDVCAAAGVPIVYGTADLALRHRAGVRPGQTVLVLGASGGVGTAAVQVII